MAKESSAINHLISLMARRPLDRDSGDELLFQPPHDAPRKKVVGRDRPSVRIVTAPALRALPALAPTMPALRVIPVTSRVAKRPWSAYAAPLAAIGVIGALAVTYFALRGNGSPPATHVVSAVDLPRAPAPPAPVIAKPAPPAPPAPVKPATSTVRIESTPEGATVSSATGQLIGTTPIDATFDRAQKVDLVIALAGHPTEQRTIDPATTDRVDVALAPVPKPAASRHHAKKRVSHHRARP